MRPRVALAALVFVAGCGAPPPVADLPSTVDLPDEFVAARDSRSGADWWMSFDDPSLREVVTQAHEQNLDLVAAAARLEAAAAQARIAGADVFPQANLTGRAARQQQILTGIPIPGREGVLESRSTSYGVSLDVQWELDLWGRLRGTRSAAGADLQAATADFAAARLSLTAQTLKAWFAVVEATRQWELAGETAASYGQTVEGVRARYERGVRPSIDLRLTMADEATARAVLEARRTGREGVLRQLELLLGRYPAAQLEVSGSLTPPPPEVPGGLPADLLTRRPDLVAAERRLAASHRRVGVSKAALFPRISLSANGGRASDQLEDLLDGDFTVWGLVGNLVQPVFQGGRLRAGVAAAEADAERALAEYANTVLRACGEVENALSRDRSLAAQESALTAAADQARAAFDLARSRYERGLDDVITLLSAQRSSAQAESRLLEVRRQRLDARVDLHLALGGGFELNREVGAS